jgi:hypothetical protein
MFIPIAMTNVETIKHALIKQIIESEASLPLSILTANIDLLISAVKKETLESIIVTDHPNTI